jgi:hypothetical protein
MHGEEDVGGVGGVNTIVLRTGRPLVLSRFNQVTCILLLSYDMYPPPLILHVSSSSHMTCILLLSYDMYPPPLMTFETVAQYVVDLLQENGLKVSSKKKKPQRNGPKISF